MRIPSQSGRAVVVALAFVVITAAAARWPAAAILLAGVIWLGAGSSKPAVPIAIAIAAAALLFVLAPPSDIAIVALFAFAGTVAASLHARASESPTPDRPEDDSLDLLRAAVESSGDGSWNWREGADPPFWYSPRTLEIFGRRPEDVTGSYEEFTSWVHPEDYPSLRADLRDHLQRSGDYELEFRVRTEAGDYHWVRGGARAALGADGLATRVSGTLRDITVRREAELALEESRRMLQTVLDTIPTRVFWKDLESVYLGCNQTFSLDAGLSDPSEIRGKTDLDLAFSDQAGVYRADDQQVMQSGKEKLYYEEPQLRPDGKLAWLRTSKIPLRDHAGRITGVLGTYEDITDHKALEEELRQAQKLEAVGRLAGGIAHDFNNVLTVILGNTEVLRTTIDVASATGAQQAAELDAIRKAGEWAASITRSLLAFSRSEVLTPRVLAVESALGNLEPMLRPIAGEKIELVFELTTDSLHVLMDARQLEQAILNLVMNARDAMPEGGRLRIASDRATISAAEAAEQLGVQPGPYARITIEDDGVGMDENTLEHIFEPFYTTKGVGKGTGLGLSLVHGIVTGSGGQVRVVSSPGTGTRFSILLPAVEETDSAEELGAHSLPSGGNETVLLCDDDVEIRRLARHMLEARGYQVLEAQTARDAVAIASSRTDPIDLVFTDVVMPELNGPQVAEQVTEQHPESRVLFMSGYTADVISRRGGLPDGASLLVKPFTSSQLLARVRETLDE
jgi:PAS domain S-box-containing protein